MAALQLYGLFVIVILLPSCYSKFKLIAVLPLEPIDSPTSSWERGLEILPGAQVAIEYLNRDISSEYQLDLVTLDSGRCQKDYKELLINFLNLTFYQNLDQVGIIGLFCSNSEQLLINVAKHVGKSLSIVSSSISTTYDQEVLASKHYYRLLQSADVLVDAFSKLIVTFKLNRIAVVSEPADKYFFGVAEALVDRATTGKNYSIIPFIQVRKEDPLFVQFIFQELLKFDSKIIFLSTGIVECIKILCMAKKRELTWPQYAWIIHTTTFSDFHGTEHAAACDVYESLEGIILLNHRLRTTTTPNLVGYTYRDYFMKYAEKLADVSTNRMVPLKPNIYANLLHDSVWVYALALRSQNGSDSDQLAKYIKNVTFNGIMGSIQFNSTSEIRTGIDILRVQNGSTVHEGYYNPVWQNITFTGSLFLPPDECKVKTDKASLIYTAVLSLFVLVCTILLTIIIILYIHYRKEPEIKSTSVTLSLLMFIGCYMILVYLLLAIIYTQSLVPSISPFNICTAIVWLSIIGISLPLILATLLVKMLRVFHIFTLYGKIGKMWSDGALLVYVLLLVSPCIVVLILWSTIDTYHAETIITEHPGFTEIEQRCISKYLLLWIGFLLVNVVTLVVVLIIVAVKTRKIRQAHFKDTKKVNAFLFVLLTIIFLTVSYWMIFRTIGINKGYSDITLHITHIFIVVSCQGFLFVPKVLPPLKRSLSKRYRFKGDSSPSGSRTHSTTITLSTN